MQPIRELNERENIVLEYCQEHAQDIIWIYKVVEYATEQGIALKESKAGAILLQFSRCGWLNRLPRSSRGWGLGWDVQAYTVKPIVIPK
jgi:hypothetical protein